MEINFPSIKNMIDITKEINKTLRLYEKEVADVIKESADKVTKEAVQELKTKSPSKTGDYARGWRRKKDGKNGFTVYNKTDYQLTHLLEHGHELESWGVKRTPDVPAYPHIEKIEKKTIEKFEKDIEDAIK